MKMVVISYLCVYREESFYFIYFSFFNSEKVESENSEKFG